MKHPPIDFIVDIASAAGALAESMKNEKLLIDYKNEKDLVSEADRAVESFIVEKIFKKYPEHGIYGEEGGKRNLNSDYLWVIDPIDGTTSYLHGQPFYSVSIGLKYRGEIVAGVVNAPVFREIFSAEKKSGAFLNGRRISVSTRKKLIESVLSTGFTCVRAGLKDNNLKYFSEIVPQIRGIRRYGSAAIDLSYVACGRLEGFWEMNLMDYDICAGVLLVEEAGGEVSDFYGKKNYPQDGLLATNSFIKSELLGRIFDPNASGASR
jgi:myo-inositol-1(or 4)-monophosphatase